MILPNFWQKEYINHMVYIKLNLLIDVMGMPTMYTINQGEKVLYEKIGVVDWYSFFNFICSG